MNLGETRWCQSVFMHFFHWKNYLFFLVLYKYIKYINGKDNQTIVSYYFTLDIVHLCECDKQTEDRYCPCLMYLFTVITFTFQHATRLRASFSVTNTLIGCISNTHPVTYFRLKHLLRWKAHVFDTAEMQLIANWEWLVRSETADCFVSYSKPELSRTNVIHTTCKVRTCGNIFWNKARLVVSFASSLCTKLG